MKAVYFSLLYSIIFFSCNHTHVLGKQNIDSSVIKLHEGQWYYNFKNEVFIRCLKKIYPKIFSELIDSLDASTAANTDQLGFNREVLNLADSLAANFAKRPEASWKIERAKVTLNVCISYRNSIELDSIAVFFYDKFHLVEK